MKRSTYKDIKASEIVGYISPIGSVYCCRCVPDLKGKSPVRRKSDKSDEKCDECGEVLKGDK